MKVSVSLSREDVAFLDAYVRVRGLESRSAALQHAVRLLRTSDLGRAYEATWNDWARIGDDVAWDATTGDGIERWSSSVGRG